MVTYTLTLSNGIQRSDGAFIPNASGNRDWEKFKIEAVERQLLTQADADANDLTNIIADGILIFPVVLPPLDEVKQAAKVEIDTTAEQARLRYITAGSGQVYVYIEKSEEAADYIATGSPEELESYPFIQAEVNATGKTPSQAANDIIVAKTAWITKSSNIELERLAGKNNVDAAISIYGITSAKQTAISVLNDL